MCMYMYHLSHIPITYEVPISHLSSTQCTLCNHDMTLDTNNALDRITYMYIHELIRYSHDMYIQSLRQDKARQLCLKTTPLTLGRLSPDEQVNSVHVLVNDM